MTKQLLCYVKKCAGKVTHKWHPSKRSGHLHICKQHFDELTMIYNVETVGQEEDITVVRVIPEQEQQ